jgi:serine/threonine-protein kinase
MRHTVPPHVGAVVAKAIEKLPADRFESAKDFMDALEDEGFSYTARPQPKAAADPQPAGARVAPGRSRQWLAATAAIAVVTAAAGWMTGVASRPEVAAAPVTAFVLEEAYITDRFPVVGSDGTIVYHEPTSRRSGQLFVRAPGTVESVPLEGAVVGGRTGDVAALSPDGAWLAFIQRSDRAVRRMPAHGGPITTLWAGEEDEPVFSPEWSDDGWIYFMTSFGLVRIAEEGGAADTLLATTDREVRRIEALPGGRGILFTLLSPGSSEGRVVLMDLDSRDTTTLIQNGFDAVYVDTGHLVYAHVGGALYAMPFDVDGLEATGSGVPVIDDLATAGPEYSRYDVSRNGTLVYARGPSSGTAEGGIPFGLMTPNGVVETYSLQPTDHFDGSLSADGRVLAYTRSGEIWLYDTELGTNDPFSSGATAPTHNPVWSPDGTELAYGAQKEGDDREFVYVQKVDGSEEPRRIEGTTGRPTQWMEDGTIIYHTTSGESSQDVYGVSAGGDAEPFALLRADWQERFPKVSPDGRWLAFQSTENGSLEVHLRRWPELTGKIEAAKDVPVNPISPVVWSLDSQRLYFVASGTLREITLSEADPPEITVRDTGVPTGVLAGSHPDGSLLHAQVSGVRAAGGEAARLIVVTNWLTALKQRLGEGNR